MTLGQRYDPTSRPETAWSAPAGPVERNQSGRSTPVICVSATRTAVARRSQEYDLDSGVCVVRPAAVITERPRWRTFFSDLSRYGVLYVSIGFYDVMDRSGSVISVWIGGVQWSGVPTLARWVTWSLFCICHLYRAQFCRAAHNIQVYKSAINVAAFTSSKSVKLTVAGSRWIKTDLEQLSYFL